MTREYSNFDVELTSRGPTYRARLLSLPGQPSVEFEFPLDEHEFDSFLGMFGKHQSRRLESPEFTKVRGVGKRLYDSIFVNDLRDALVDAANQAKMQGKGTRIRLDLSDAPDLVTLPWEYLYRVESDDFVSLSNWTPVVRYLDVAQPLPATPLEGPLKVLVMISDPIERRGILNVESEWRQLNEALEQPIADRAVDITLLPDGRIESLQLELQRNDYHVFHFIGHGEFSEEFDDGVLALEDSRGREVHVSGSSLGNYLRDSLPMRLVVLNNCEGAATSDSDPFAGSAQSLLRKGLPAIVAMQFEITDRAAIDFAQGFYTSLGNGFPVDAALAEARKVIRDGPTRIEFGSPVLYMSATDGTIFTKDVAEELPEEGKPAVELLASSVPSTHPGESGVEHLAQEQAGLDQPQRTDEEEEGKAPPEDHSETTGEETPVKPSTPSGLRERLASLPLMGAIGVAVVAVGIFLVVRFLPDAGTTQATTQPDTTSVSERTTVPGGTTIAPDGEAVAQRINQPVEIDGSPDDWPNEFLHTTAHLIYLNVAVRDDPGARGGEPNSSLIQLAWDETFLYVFAEVEDDVIAAPESGDQIWRNDAVNFNISVIGPDGIISETVDDDDHQLTLDANQASAHFFIGGSALSLGFADVVTVPRSESGYLLEARLPWEEIGVQSPQPGDRFGLLLTVFDNDGDFPQAEIRANTPPGGDELDNRWFRGPQTWGRLTLEG